MSMKLIKYAILSLLCCFLLAGCAETDFVSTSTQADSEYSETATPDTKQKKKTKKKKKNNKSKKNNKNKKKEPKKVTGEYSSDSDVVEAAKSEDFNQFDFYKSFYVADEVTCGEALNHFFDATQWTDYEDDDFEGVEFIGTRYKDNDTWEYYLYYKFDGGFFDNWLGGCWLDDFKIYKNGKRERNNENENSVENIMFCVYGQFVEDYQLE